MNRYEALLAWDFFSFIRHYDGEFTYFNEIKEWMASDPRLYRCGDVDEFKELMRQDDYFRLRHFAKLDEAIDHFLASKL